MDRSQRKANEALTEFIRYSSSPWRLMWSNFIAGVFRGLGAIIGASFFIALILWLLTLFVDIPLVGEHAADIKETFNGYINDTNYNDEFERMSEILERIEQEIAKQKITPEG